VTKRADPAAPAKPGAGVTQGNMTSIRRRLSMALLLGLLLVACEQTPDEEQIAQHIAAMQAAVEDKDFLAIKEQLHKDFVANRHMDALEVKRLLQVYSLQHQRIGVTIVDSETTMDPAFYDRAESILSVVVTGSSGLLPSDGSVRKVRLTWTKEDGDWSVLSADWKF